MTYGVDALPHLREQIEDCPATSDSAKLVLIDEFCELSEGSYQFVCYVKLYFTTEEIVVARKKIWKAGSRSPPCIFSRVHKLKDIVLRTDRFLIDTLIIVDSSDDDKQYCYQIHFSGDIKEWVYAFKLYCARQERVKNGQAGGVAAAVTNVCGPGKEASDSSGRVSSMVLWNRADCQCVSASARTRTLSCSRELPSHLVTPVRSRISNLFCTEAFISRQDDSSSPEPSGIDLDSISMHEEGDTSKDEVERAPSSNMEQAWTGSSDDFLSVSSYSDAQVASVETKIRTLDTAVCNKGHARNKSTSLTRGVQVITRSNSTISNAASDPGADPRVDSGMVVQSGLSYTNVPAVLRSVSFDCQSSSIGNNSFLSSPFRHTQIRGKKVKFSPRQNMLCSQLPIEDDSEQCLIFENGTQDSSCSSATPENFTPPDNEVDSTVQAITPTRSVPTTQRERMASVFYNVSFTPPKRKLVSRLFRRRTTSSISDIDEGSHLELESSEPQKALKKKLYQLDPKLVAAQLALIDSEMLRKIKLDELKGGAWVGKNKETRAPNIMKMVQEFNRLALLVPTEILEEKNAAARAKVIVCYIQIADKCRKFGNYNSLKAILAGLQCTPIYRLKKTWKEVSGRRKKKFEDLSCLMTEEDNWRVYKIELSDTMSKGSCVPFLGQFLTQIVQQETVNEVKLYRRKSHGRRPQSGDLSSDNRETLSAPTTPVNSEFEELEVNVAAPNSGFQRKSSAPSNIHLEVKQEDDKNNEQASASELVEEEKGIKRDPSSSSFVERRDTLSPLPIGKFKKNSLLPTNLYRESFRKSSLSPAMSPLGLQNGQPTLIKAEPSAGEEDMVDETCCELKDANSGIDKMPSALKQSLESLDSYDGASSSYSRGSTPMRDVPDSEAEDAYYTPVLDVSQVELTLEDNLETPTFPINGWSKESSPVEGEFDPVENATTPDIDIETVVENLTANSDDEKSPTGDGKKKKKKRKWSSFRRKSPSPVERNNANDCNDTTPRRKLGSSLRRKLSSPIRMISGTSNNDNVPENNDNLTEPSSPTTRRKLGSSLRRKLSSPIRMISGTSINGNAPEKNGTLQRACSPTEDDSLDTTVIRKMSLPIQGSSTSNCDDITTQERNALTRKISSPGSIDAPKKREKLHIYNNNNNPDMKGFDIHTMLQQMQFSSLGYMKSVGVRQDVQSFIKGLRYNSEEDNYHISIQTEPLQNNNC